MRKTTIFLCLALGLLGPGEAALAKGCIKGAVVGGIAGHYAGHHGFLGALGGCLYGRHLAHKNTRTDRRYTSQHNDGRGWL